MTGPALEAVDVRLELGGQPVLDGVSLRVGRGEVVALVGPNGAGKSTLLAVLAGDHVPDRGRVLLDGQPLAQHRVGHLARRRGVLLQETRVSFPFLVRDVVQMGRAPWQGTDREEQDDAVVDAALAGAEVTHLAGRRYPTLSGGEKARTGFARVLAQQVPTLLLDEPTAALDIRHQEAVLREVRARADAGDAVVVVLHDLSLAAAHADRVVLLEAGRVRAAGPPREVLTTSLLTEVYRHPVEVVERSDGGGLLVLPVRGGGPRPGGAAPPVAEAGPRDGQRVDEDEREVVR